MKRAILWLCSLSFAADLMAADNVPLYQNEQVPLENRVTDLLQRLTVEEKVILCYGGFLSGGVPRLTIPQIAMSDGRQGVRQNVRTTLLPCALALSCTWDKAAAHEFGEVLAEEMLALKKNVLLAPNLNLVRSPLGGRNFENYGEDPFLAGSIGLSYIQGLQAQGVGACACLLVANDCEQDRHFTSSNMDERTLRELHLLPYELAVRDGHVWSMMSGNNLLNGVRCAQNANLIQCLIKDGIGFDGVMITDWRAAYDTVPAALAGTDITTGICSYIFGSGHLLAAVRAGEVPMGLLDDKARRILRLYFRCGLLDPSARGKGSLNIPEHRESARKLAVESMVLLKNEDGLLPLNLEKIHRILITGPGATVTLGGLGSGFVNPIFNITPLQGLQSMLAGKVQITNLSYSIPSIQKGNVDLNGQARKKIEKTTIEVIPVDSTLANVAKSVDAVIFIATGKLGSEGVDLADMKLPGGQANAIAALAKANSNTVVVLVNNGAVSLEPWLQDVPALLAIHYAGEETGDALADVLTGKANPSGKLSYTFGKKLGDYPCHALGEWPAKLILPQKPGDPGMKPQDRKNIHAYDADYKEGVFTGYRWFDERKIEPYFPFGFGLSYTTFKLSRLEVKKNNDAFLVACLVKNTGSKTGAEVVQVYIAPGKSSVLRPPRELKGFAKVVLEPGESKQVAILLRPSALAFYDVANKKWEAEAGDYQVEVGVSSRDLRLKSTITLPVNEAYPVY